MSSSKVITLWSSFNTLEQCEKQIMAQLSLMPVLGVALWQAMCGMYSWPWSPGSTVAFQLLEAINCSRALLSLGINLPQQPWQHSSLFTTSRKLQLAPDTAEWEAPRVSPNIGGLAAWHLGWETSCSGCPGQAAFHSCGTAQQCCGIHSLIWKTVRLDWVFVCSTR